MKLGIDDSDMHSYFVMQFHQESLHHVGIRALFVYFVPQYWLRHGLMRLYSSWIRLIWALNWVLNSLQASKWFFASSACEAWLCRRPMTWMRAPLRTETQAARELSSSTFSVTVTLYVRYRHRHTYQRPPHQPPPHQSRHVNWVLVIDQVKMLSWVSLELRSLAPEWDRQ